VLFRSEAIIAT